MNEFETFWDNIDQELEDTKATTGLKYVVRGSLAKKPALRSNQSTSWVQFKPSSIGIHGETLPTKLLVSVFVTGPAKSNIHQTHVEAVKLALKVAKVLDGFLAVSGDAKNSGAILSLDKDESFQVIEDNPRAYTMAVVFNTHLNITP